MFDNCDNKTTIEGLLDITQKILKEPKHTIPIIVEYCNEHPDFTPIFISFMQSHNEQTKEALHLILDYQYNEIRNYLEDCFKLEYTHDSKMS